MKQNSYRPLSLLIAALIIAGCGDAKSVDTAADQDNSLTDARTPEKTEVAESDWHAQKTQIETLEPNVRKYAFQVEKVLMKIADEVASGNNPDPKTFDKINSLIISGTTKNRQEAANEAREALQREGMSQLIGISFGINSATYEPQHTFAVMDVESRQISIVRDNEVIQTIDAEKAVTP